MRSSLTWHCAAGDSSQIEMGKGSYVETRYEFADAVFEEFVLEAWGQSEDELTGVLERMVELVLALTYLAHEALTLHLRQVSPDAFEVLD